MPRLPYNWLIFIRIEKLEHYFLRPLHSEKSLEEHEPCTRDRKPKTTGDRPASSGSASTKYDILGALKISFQESKTQYIATSEDGFPAFGIRAGSDVKSPYRLFLPEKLFSEFSILARVQPTTRRGGYLFAVVNPLETVVQLGIKLSPAGPGTNVSLIYTHPGHFPSQVIADFITEKLVHNWVKFAFQVNNDNITLFLNCKKHGTVSVRREPQQLVFDSASTLYIGQAGPIIKDSFEITYELVILKFIEEVLCRILTININILQIIRHKKSSQQDETENLTDNDTIHSPSGETPADEQNDDASEEVDAENVQESSQDTTVQVSARATLKTGQKKKVNGNITATNFRGSYRP
ncbi:hypothetical protein FQA39_LY03966 [Lamprigera yunnana]|nr:hypothetical protein FQA39_LY03966 [Lamprigera yunnana]